MNLKRIWIMIKARNKEFFRDRAAFGWNFLFPFLIIAGFSVVFGGKEYATYKIGVFPVDSQKPAPSTLIIPETLQTNKTIEFIGFKTENEGISRLKHHKIDFLLKNDSPEHAYWVNQTSPKGYLLERLFNGGIALSQTPVMGKKGEVNGREIRYIDWLFPGILGMNMMFSALWGVGYVVVRYRKTGVLKRLKATPLSAFEYLTAQMISRLFLLMFTLIVVWVGCDLIFDFHVEGSYLDLIVIFFMGGLSLTALGLILASRGTSEEFTSGVLNFLTWPMMFLSEVWFSIEGSPQWVKNVANVFPLTHMLSGVRKIMNDGATLMDVHTEIEVMALMALLFLAIGASLFSWNS